MARPTDISNNEELTILHEEVEKRYLAYALSTIVARALPDVRDGLKPVHRRILYAMHGMRLGDAARMRKSAAVVGEVIGKFHPHGDQAAYDALVRMAQDFSLRYPLIEGSGNFGSIDGDSPAAMRYTETKLSAFAGLLLREIDQGTTVFRPTYDGTGEEPMVMPAAVPNLLLNGSSGIAVGMSCSFPPHNLREVMAACRASIANPEIDVPELLQHIKGPDFPTGAELVESLDHLREIYSTGHGSVRVRGSFTVESVGRGRTNLILTSLPYTVNKARLIERIASLIRDKKFKQVVDIRDESAKDIRVVLELRGADVNPEVVGAYLYKNTDFQINFPINFIAVTGEGVPDRLSLNKIIRHFLDFRYEITVMRLEHRLDELTKRIHLLEGFEILFVDIDLAIKIIREARSRADAETGLMTQFKLDKIQADAILEMRLYRLVGLEIGKLLSELKAKRKEAEGIKKDLAGPKRLWRIIDREFANISDTFGDDRRTRIVKESAAVIEFDPDQFVDHEDTSVIVSVQGWIKRIKSEIDDPSALKFRDDDDLLAWVRVNTGRPVALITNLGKLYVVKALDVPLTTGFGEPLSNLFNFADGECVVSVIAPDPVLAPVKVCGPQPQWPEEAHQEALFDDDDCVEALPAIPFRAVLATKKGQGFRFEYSVLREVTKKAGRRLAVLKDDDQIVAVMVDDRERVCVLATDGNALVFPMEHIPILSGPGLGVRLMKLKGEAEIVSMLPVERGDTLHITTKADRIKAVALKGIPVSNRDAAGKNIAKSGIRHAIRVDKRMTGDSE